MLSWNVDKRAPTVSGRGGCSLESSRRTFCSASLTMPLVLVLQLRQLEALSTQSPLTYSGWLSVVLKSRTVSFVLVGFRMRFFSDSSPLVLSSTTVVSSADLWRCAGVSEVMFVGCREGDMALREARAEAKGTSSTLWVLSEEVPDQEADGVEHSRSRESSIAPLL